jgi:hypothetical protein
MERLIGFLHEMRHLIQIGDPETRYYREIDSDLFARAILRDQSPGLGIDPTKNLKENIFARYSTLLTSPPSYQIAPAIEAFEAGKKPPDVKALGAALKTIRCRIIEKETGKYPGRQDEEKFDQRCKKEPEVIYSLLRRCVEDGAFSQNPLATHIANRILEAVEYFSEGLTRNPAVVNKIYPAPGL